LCFVRFEFSSRSCDLDEWTAEQLEIMKIGGNANALNFFKKYGVTETQMQVKLIHTNSLNFLNIYIYIE
jgi:hypothetical protein